MRYAVFPGSRRVAVEQGGKVAIYDTGDHRIGGVSQQQSGDQAVTFTSQHGVVRLQDLAPVQPEAEGDRPPKPHAPPPNVPEAAEPSTPAASAPATRISAVGSSGGVAANESDDVIFSRLERLAELRAKDIITAEEFDAKKAELLSRL
jgi:Short C-terminal domain